MSTFLYAIIGLILGVVSYHLYLKSSGSDPKARSKKIVDDARREAEKLELEAKNKLIEAKDKARSLEEEVRNKVKEDEKLLREKEANLDKKEAKVEELRDKLDKRQEEFDKKEKDILKKEEEVKGALEKISGLSKDQAKKELFKQVEEIYEKDMNAHLRKYEEKIKEEEKEISQKILTQAIQRYASEVSSESTATVVELANDEMKGRIIGKEGRNIQTFEKITGVDVIIDDTPNTVLLSGFDLLRRYIAKVALERLLEDGRIQPARIEEIVNQVKQEVITLTKELGEKAFVELGITPLHPDLVRLIGRLRFRTSYGQNILKHSIEVGHLCGIMAAELGLDASKAKLVGLLHDLGKAVTHEVEGSHAIIGANILRKYKVDPEVINAVESHHEEVPQETLYAPLVQSADAISGARVGARSGNIEEYIQRLQKLENLATSFEGVKRAYAISAGREVRVFVEPEKTTDSQSIELASNIAQKIESDMQYPGEIKVNVIREFRTFKVAR